ncbi:PIN domain-containing protein [Rhodanobacter terrae]|uniref:PIN domain-containing protein n=1 Tax=Rhodanobacter terrae TaxID=418647 RepID=A0ABW0SRU3_9GAMM
MIGLDTNVLVRYIMQDDVAQSAKASVLLDTLTVDAPGWISIVSVIELVWVLGGCYGLDRTQLFDALEALLRTKELRVDRAEVVWKAVRSCSGSKVDFADCLIACSAASVGCDRIMTFDRAAAKHAGMSLIA